LTQTHSEDHQRSGQVSRCVLSSCYVWRYGLLCCPWGGEPLSLDIFVWALQVCIKLEPRSTLVIWVGWQLCFQRISGGLHPLEEPMEEVLHSSPSAFDASPVMGRLYSPSEEVRVRDYLLSSLNHLLRSLGSVFPDFEAQEKKILQDSHRFRAREDKESTLLSRNEDISLKPHAHGYSNLIRESQHKRRVKLDSSRFTRTAEVKPGSKIV
jgi:hypothetical protein